VIYARTVKATPSETFSGSLKTARTLKREEREKLKWAAFLT
jgi:hypothetical protein